MNISSLIGITNFISSGVLVAQNLLLWSEQMDNSGTWDTSSVTVTANADGIYDLITMAVSGGNRINQVFTGMAAGNYNYSFDVKRGTATDMQYSVFNITAGSDIVAPTSYYSLTNGSTYTTITVNFTVPGGSPTIWIYPERDAPSTGNFYCGKNWLYQGSKSYVTTTSSIVP